MRCKVGDIVVVVGGAGVGCVGRVVSASDYAPEFQWLVEFPRPVRGYGLNGRLKRLSSRRMNCLDADLLPIRPDPTPETVTDDIEVPA